MEGKVLGHCKLVRLLGKGGMGEVWLARHETLQKDVAVKLLPADFTKNAEAVERFLREARSAARLEHPNVVQVLDAGSSDGVPFIVMQYVDGTDLDKVLKKKGKFEISDALSIGKKMAQALGAAHRLGIVHRDVKPANVLLTKQGRVMVADFGLARDAGDATITTEGIVMGTPQYLAPEQARGEKVDARSDLYSLGCSLYHFIAGHPPYTGNTPLSVALKHTSEHDRPEPLKAPPEVAALVAKLMAKKVVERFQSADELVAAIDRVKGKGGGSDEPTMVRVSEDQVLTPQRKRRLIVTGVGAGLGGLVLLIVLLGALGPSKAEKSFRAASQAKTTEERVVRFRETAQKFPGDEWAKRAEEEIGRLFDADLKALKADGKLGFGERLAKLDAMRLRYPERGAAVDRVEDEQHRARILERTEQLAEGLKGDRPAERVKIRELLHADVLKKHGESGLRFWIGLSLGIMLGPNGKIEKIDYSKDKLEVARRKAASLPLKVSAVKSAGEKRDFDMTLDWIWDAGDWFLPERWVRENK